MGFDAVSLWDFRRAKDHKLNKSNKDNEYVDAWGRVYKNGWYSWDGVFKDLQSIENWVKLNPPGPNEIQKLKKFLNRTKGIEYALSLPGLFEKTWQSMGFITFSKSLRKDKDLIENVIDFFYNYIKDLINVLQEAGTTIFLIADDFGYKKRTFIPKIDIRKLFFEKYRKITHLIHLNRNKVILHSDGYISNLIDMFVDIGFDGIQSIEPNSGNNIFTLFKKYNGQICFIGNLDNGAMLTYADPSDIRNYIGQLIEIARKYKSPLVISPTQQINSIAKPENIHEMIQTVKEYNKKI